MILAPKQGLYHTSALGGKVIITAREVPLVNVKAPKLNLHPSLSVKVTTLISPVDFTVHHDQGKDYVSPV